MNYRVCPGNYISLLSHVHSTLYAAVPYSIQRRLSNCGKGRPEACCDAQAFKSLWSTLQKAIISFQLIETFISHIYILIVRSDVKRLTATAATWAAPCFKHTDLTSDSRIVPITAISVRKKTLVSVFAISSLQDYQLLHEWDMPGQAFSKGVAFEAYAQPCNLRRKLCN